ncbi:baseplate assembly protein [Acetobacter sp. TBRC 12305]|uniref:Baseplate assembly protein n=2 Tax=Acetobacter garciniae TaxID=2817435 RepID=A0A939HQ67_9PROT|nr:baseplate assembly protein [Acetobacter garciniae]MBX0345213.1 baseplate assembly protein [Acetobacter garciniae]
MNAAIRRVLSMLGTPLPVQVRAVNGGGVAAVGFVDVQPMVHQQDGAGRPVPHGIIHNVPYIRLQGGSCAIICDPCVGDIGYILISGRDISNVKATRAASAPGSFRQHDMADAVYLGGLLNAAPTEYIGWVGGDVHVHTKGRFVIDAAQCQINCALNVQGAVSAGGDVKAGSISLESHTHSGVQAGSASTGAPQ